MPKCCFSADGHFASVATSSILVWMLLCKNWQHLEAAGQTAKVHNGMYHNTISVDPV